MRPTRPTAPRTATACTSPRPVRAADAHDAHPRGRQPASTSAVSSTSAPPSGAGCGSTTCAPARTASTTGIGGTPRRARPPRPADHAGRRRAASRLRRRARRPPIPAARPVRAGVARAKHLDRGDGVVTQPRSALIALTAASSAIRCTPPQRGVVQAMDHRRGATGRRGVWDAVTSRSPGHGETSCCGQAGPCSAERASRLVQLRTLVKRASRCAVSAASARDRNGPSARSCRGMRTTEKRGNASSLNTTHHQRCGMWTGGCTAGHARQASAAPARRLPARARIRCARQSRPA